MVSLITIKYFKAPNCAKRIPTLSILQILKPLNFIVIPYLPNVYCLSRTIVINTATDTRLASLNFTEI